MESEGIQSGCYAVSGLGATDNETDQRKRNLSRRVLGAKNFRFKMGLTGRDGERNEVEGDGLSLGQEIGQTQDTLKPLGTLPPGRSLLRKRSRTSTERKTRHTCFFGKPINVVNYDKNRVVNVENSFRLQGP
jgi:hypothetical protein